MTVAGVAISGTEDEDPAEYFDGHEDTGDLLDPLVDNAEAEEATKAKLKEPDRLAEFEVCETVDLHVAPGKMRVTTRWGLDRRKGRNQSTIRRGESSRVTKHCMMCLRQARLRARACQGSRTPRPFQN